MTKRTSEALREGPIERWSGRSEGDSAYAAAVEDSQLGGGERCLLNLEAGIVLDQPF